MSTADLFTPIAEHYDQWFATPLGQYVAQQELKLLESVLSALTPGTAVDVGAGTGFATQVLIRHHWDVVAVEPSKGMRAIGKRKFSQIQWIDAVAESLPFDSHAFDLVMLFTVLEFVHSPSQTLQEVWRVLKPGGRLIIGFLEAESGWVAHYRHLGDQDVAPWNSARFYDHHQLEQKIGKPIVAKQSAIWLAPSALPPYDEADAAGRRAGNAPAFSLVQWEK